MAGTSDIVVRFLADTKDLTSATAEVQSTGDRLKSWAKGVGVAIGAAFAVQQLKEATDAAAEFADVVGAAGVIFGNQADEIQAWANKNANSFLMSKGQAIDAANTFATFGKAAGKTGTDLTEFSTSMVGLAGDLSSFRGGTVEEAITAIGAALRGENEPIRQYGVLLDDATLRARAFAMGISDGTSVLTPAQKTLAAQAEILAQTSDAQGDAARTADSAANQQRKMAASVADAKVALGTALLPVLQAILPIITKLAQLFEKYSKVLVPLAGIIFAVVAAQWAWNAAAAANPIGLIVIAIAALVAGIVILIDNWGAVADAFGAAWDFIWNGLKTVWEWIKANWPLILGILTGPIGIAVALIIKYWDQIRAGIEAALNWVKDNWPLILVILTGPIGIAVYLIARYWEDVKRAFGAALDFIRNLAGNIVGWLVAPFADAVNQVVGIFSGLPGQIAGALSGFWNIGRQVMEDFLGGIESMIGQILSKVGSVAGKVADALNPFGSPQTISYYAGRDAMRDYAAGIQSQAPRVAAMVRGLAPAVSPAGFAGGSSGGVTHVYVNVTSSGLGADSPAIQRDVVNAIRKYVTRNGPVRGVATP